MMSLGGSRLSWTKINTSCHLSLCCIAAATALRNQPNQCFFCSAYFCNQYKIKISVHCCVVTLCRALTYQEVAIDSLHSAGQSQLWVPRSCISLGTRDRNPSSWATLFCIFDHSREKGQAISGKVALRINHHCTSTWPALLAESWPLILLQVLQNSGAQMMMLRVKTQTALDDL